MLRIPFAIYADAKPNPVKEPTQFDNKTLFNLRAPSVILQSATNWQPEGIFKEEITWLVRNASELIKSFEKVP